MGMFLTASKLEEVVPGLTQDCKSSAGKSNYSIEMLSMAVKEDVIR